MPPGDPPAPDAAEKWSLQPAGRPIEKSSGRKRQAREASLFHAQQRKYAIAVAVVALLSFIQTVTYDFTFDDVPIVRDNPLLTSLANVPEIFQTNYWGDSSEFKEKSVYRPLVILTYALQHSLHGDAPVGYHVFNIFAHVLCSFLLFRFLLLLVPTPKVALVAALLFAVHPIHTEVVAGIVGRAEILALSGILLSSFAYFRAVDSLHGPTPVRVFIGWAGISLLAYAAGIFSKETGLVAPAVMVLTELLFPRTRRLLRLDWRAVVLFLGYGAITALYFMLRQHAVQTEVRAIDFADLSVFQRVATGLRVCAEYVGLLLFPGTLLADYPRDEFPVSSALSDPAVLIALLLVGLAAGLVIWSWKREPVACWGLLLFLGVLFPLSNIPFAIGVMKAERLLYTPSAGFLVAATALVANRARAMRSGDMGWSVLYVAVGLLFVRTLFRNPDWKNNLTLATATLQTAPTSQKFQTILVNWYREHGRDDLARSILTSGGRSVPNSVAGRYNLANVELDARRYDEAIRLYQNVLEIEPDHEKALNNLGRALSEAGRIPEAIEHYEAFRRQMPDSPGPYINLMDLYVREDQTALALPVAEEALRRFPDMDAVQWNAGAIFRALGRTGEAEAAFREAARLNPAITTQRDIRR